MNKFTKSSAVAFIAGLRALHRPGSFEVKRTASHCGKPDEWFRSMQVCITVDVPWIAEDGLECHSLRGCAHFIFMFTWRKSSGRWSVTASSSHGHPGYCTTYRPGRWAAGYALSQMRAALVQQERRDAVRESKRAANALVVIMTGQPATVEDLKASARAEALVNGPPSQARLDEIQIRHLGAGPKLANSAAKTLAYCVGPERVAEVLNG